MVLQLDPSVPFVWRTPQSVQLGVDEVRAVVDELTTGEERLLAALGAGISDTGYAMLARSAGVDADAAAALLAAVAPALAPSVSASAADAGRVAVLGAGPLAEELARQFADDELLAGPRDVVRLAVLVTAWVVSPADHGTWLRRDLPHLPVVIGDGGITIGPLVEPGLGACLYCVQLRRTDADPAWPAIATQLWGRPSPALDRTAIAEAAAFAARRVRDRLNAGPAESTTSWRLNGSTGAISAREWARHPACLCAAPPESDWARDAAPASPRVPTRARERVALS